jgi:amidase
MPWWCATPEALKEAQAADARRAKGETLGPLDGIPYTAKDSYLVKGLTAASGSPAFADLVACRDAFTIERLRGAGAICLGKTNMPPMANGGMQRGVYGRAQSPYNGDYLTAPFASGSSNGAGTATAASFAAFGLAEETWSSGRGPASNNGLCAYTPSRGVISVRGNWPLTPTMDVVVPFARTMADLLEVLDVVVAPDSDTRGDLWRLQPWVPIPAVESVRPASYVELAVKADALAGKRLGIPRMYINADPQAGTSDAPGIGGPTGQRINTRPSVIGLWQEARKALEAAGAEVIEVDFPLVSNCEGDRPGAPTVFNRGIVSKEFLHHELWDLSAWAFDDFLRANGDPKLNRLVDVDGPKIFPTTPAPCRIARVISPLAWTNTCAWPSAASHHGTRSPRWPTACAAWKRPARWIWKTGWIDWDWTRCCSRRWPMSARRMPTSTPTRRISPGATASGWLTATSPFATWACRLSPYRWA